MSSVTENFHMQQLTELLVQLAQTGDDEDVLLDRAVVTMAEAVEAEIAAVVEGQRVRASIGFERDDVPVGLLCDLAAGRSQTVEMAGVVLHASMARLENDGHVVLARRSGSFTPAESALTQGMASALALCLRSARLLARERQLRRHSEHQAREARRDPLTRLVNRSVFFERLANASDRARSLNTLLAVLFMDLDGFKHVNDTLGHDVGDELLLAVAGRLRNAVRADDVVARLGGDEFAVLIEDVDGASTAEVLASHLCAALTSPFSVRGRMVTVRASIGIALGPHPSDDPQLLLRDADVAMYRAKAERPGGFVVFDQPMQDAVAARAGLADELRRAVRGGQLRMEYQPVIQLATGRTVGIEALVRWDHPERGSIPPSTFIPLAEELGLIFELGDWILDTSCRQMASMSRRGVRDVNIAVNVSSHQLHDPGFADRIRAALDRHDVPPTGLVLEITETAALSDNAIVFEQLAALDHLGIPIALDDFGTGYSSLSHLSRLPIAILKIDRSFVTRLLTSSRHAALTESVVELGHRLELDVVAEGIEDARQLAALQAMGCPYGQGYLLGRPGPAAELAEELLTAHDGRQA